MEKANDHAFRLLNITVVNEPYGVSLWKYFLISASLWKYISRDWENFSRFIKFEVSNGTKVKFWYDIWCGDLPLKEAFLELFHLARNREALVSDHMQFRNDTFHWVFDFIKTVPD